MLLKVSVWPQQVSSLFFYLLFPIKLHFMNSYEWIHADFFKTITDNCCFFFNQTTDLLLFLFQWIFPQYTGPEKYQ